MIFFKPRKPVGEEQRHYLRVPTIFPVEIRFIDKRTGHSASKIIQCFTHDISKGGMCLEVYAPAASFKDYLESDQYKILLIITPPFSKHPITAFALKTWSKTVKDKGLEKILVGVCYDSIIEQDRKRLYSYVNSLKRKPYEIATLIILLIAFASYISLYYYNASEQNKDLHQNLSYMQEIDQHSQKKLNEIKKEKIILEGQLDIQRQEKQKLKKAINTIALNKTDEKVEALISHLKNSNVFLKDNLDKVNQELALTRKQLLTLKDKQYALHVSGTEKYPTFNENMTLDIITLNNTNILMGHLTRTDPDVVTIELLDQTESTLLPTEIAAITTVKLVDKSLYTKEGETTTSSQDAQLTHRDTRLDFLKKIEYDTFKYFTSEINKENGLVKDNSDPNTPANIGTLGFAIVSYCIATEKGWMDFDDAYHKTLTALRTTLNTLEHKNGFFYHFVNLKTGKRAWSSEVSSMDTALFIAGALVAKAYFKDSEIATIAQQLYERVDWTWMTNGKNSLCMGWKPESDFLPYYWHTFNESLLAYILAIGSPTHPLPSSIWHNIKRPVARYKDQELVYSQTGSLFVYQYPHIFVNFKDEIEDGFSYWKNTIAATYANRQFCIDMQGTYSAYGKNTWGLTASDGPKGYKGYGAKPGINLHDGTIAPSAIAGSLPLTPEISIPALRYIYDTYKNHIYGFYGFRDSFNINQSWFSNKYIGNNQGLTLTMIENYLNGFVWKHFEQSEAFLNWKEKIKKV